MTFKMHLLPVIITSTKSQDYLTEYSRSNDKEDTTVNLVPRRKHYVVILQTQLLIIIVCLTFFVFGKKLFALIKFPRQKIFIVCRTRS